MIATISPNLNFGCAQIFRRLAPLHHATAKSETYPALMSADFHVTADSRFAEGFDFIRSLPGERQFAASKMPVRCRQTVDGTPQVQALDDGPAPWG
jgi:hypothetical protein